MKSKFFVPMGVFLAGLIFSVASPSLHGQVTEEAKRERLKDIASDFWIYDDVEAGYSRAAETGKPLLVSFRCVP